MCREHEDIDEGDVVALVAPNCAEGGELNTIGNLFVVEKIDRTYCTVKSLATDVVYHSVSVGRFEFVRTQYPNPPHEHCDIIKAWADGAEIEYFNRTGSKWVTIGNPSWKLSGEYRIKPENPNSDKIEEIERKMRELADELKELKDE